MTFAIEVEGGIDRRKITNYDEVSVNALFSAVVYIMSSCTDLS